VVTVGVMLEYRFPRDAGGRVRAGRHYSYDFWRDRYLDQFDHVVVCGRTNHPARSAEGEEPPEPGPLVEGPGVTFVPGSLSSLGVTKGRVSPAPDAWILRLPGVFGQARWRTLAPAAALGIEIVGDPATSIPAAIPGPRGQIMGRFLAHDLKKLAGRADGVAYVSREALEPRYPARRGAVVSEYSSVELDDEWFRPQEASSKRDGSVPFRLITIASMDRPYKGVDTLIRAGSRLRDRGLRVELDVVGDGHLRPRYEALASELGVNDSVRFHGQLSREQVRELLDCSDVFVLASQTEGLPRALLEAMARRVPCLATPVGGIPYLLEDDSLFPVGDATRLSDLASALLGDPGLRDRTARRNAKVVTRFHREELRRRRGAFYGALANIASQRRRFPT
jgi:phosphatidyl-myo-inositol dimannoside synthase